MGQLKIKEILGLLEQIDNHFMVARHADFGYYNVSLKDKAEELIKTVSGDISIVNLVSSIVARFQIEELQHKYSAGSSYIKFASSQPALFDPLADLQHILPEARAYLESINFIETSRRSLEEAIAIEQPLKIKKRQESGYIYLIRSPLGYKIGKTRNIRQRNNLFSVKMPFEFEFLCYKRCNGYHNLEIRLHDSYSNKRINGEWFDLCQKDVDDIIKVLSDNEVGDMHELQ